MNSVLELLSKVERFLAAGLILILTVFVVVDVGAREIFKLGIPWAQKGAVYMMIWAGFLGAILIAQKAEHLRPEAADKLWKGAARIWFLRTQNFLVFIFCSVMCWYSIDYVMESKEFADRNVIIDMPMWVLQAIIPYSFLSMALRYLYFTFSPKEKDPKAVH